MNRSAPAELGFKADRLARLKPVFQAYVDQRKLAGLITAVARNGRIAHLATYGWADVEAQKPVQEDTIFRIASMTKPVTTAAAMMLYEKGAFQLDDPVSRFIPALAALKVRADRVSNREELLDLEREITVRDLMTHTSGIIYSFSYDKTLAENIEKLVKIPLGSQPGSKWQYSESTSVLAYLVELIAGTSFDRFLQRQIFDPLQMVDTAYYVPAEKQDRLAKVYAPSEGGGLEAAAPLRRGDYLLQRPLFSGSSGLVATAVDYLRFAQMLLNGGELDGARLLAPRTVGFMLRNHVPEHLLPLRFGDLALPGLGFGLGGYVVRDASRTQLLEPEGSFGWSGSVGTDFWLDPANGVSGLVLRQFVPFDLYPLAQQLKVLTYQALVD